MYLNEFICLEKILGEFTGSYSEAIVKFSFSNSKKRSISFLWKNCYIGGMVRGRLISFFIVIISFFLVAVTPSEAQETGTLSVTTMPVGGAIYVDYVFMGTRFWSGNLNAGLHVVSFGDVDGYSAPSPQTVTVVADQTYYIVGVYRKLLSSKK